MFTNGETATTIITIEACLKFKSMHKSFKLISNCMLMVVLS